MYIGYTPPRPQNVNKRRKKTGVQRFWASYRITPDFRICMHNFGARAIVTPTCRLNLSIRSNFQFDCSNHDAILARIHPQALVTNPWILLSSFRSKNIASVVSRSFHSLLFHFVIRSWHLNKYSATIVNAVVAERLRRWAQIFKGYFCVGSNPVRDDLFLFFFYYCILVVFFYF